MKMSFKEFLMERGKKTANRMAKKSEKDARRAAALDAVSKLHAHQQAIKLAQIYDGKPMKITRPVIVANGKTEMREFTIDNTLPVRRALAGVTFKDMNQVESDPAQRSDRHSYAIEDRTNTKGSSIPHRLFGLPPRTRHKSDYAPEDLRREAFE